MKTKFNDSSILITIISCEYFNLSLTNEYVEGITIPIQVIKYYTNASTNPIAVFKSNQIILI